MGAKTRSSKKAIFEFENVKMTRKFEAVLTKVSMNFSRGLLAIFASLIVAVSVILSGCTSASAPVLKSATINTPTIKESGILKVGVNTSLSPLAGMGNNKIIGIDVDIAGSIADELGLKLQIVDTGSTPGKSIQNGEVDIALGVDKSDVPSGTKLSEEYLQTGTCLFALSSKAGSIPSVDSSPKIAAQTSSKSAWAVTNIYGRDSLTSSADMSAVFQSLTSGTVDYVAADAIIGKYANNRNNSNAQIIALLESASGYCCAVSETNTDLNTTISQTIKTLKDKGIIDTIVKKWLGDKIDLSNIMKVEKGTSETSSTTASATDANSITSSN